MCRAVDAEIKDSNIASEDFCLLLTDAATYMKSAGIAIKYTYIKLFHVTCVALLMHNCAIRVKGYYDGVDALISSIKHPTLKSKDMQMLFDELGTPCFCHTLDKLVERGNILRLESSQGTGNHDAVELQLSSDY